MQNRNDCLNEAMFIASESYSGSTYENSLFEAMDKGCDEIVVIMQDDNAASVPVMTAA
jgi:hypothetical protein